MANLWLTGAGEPTLGTGEQGDYYRDTVTNLVYFRENPTTWAEVPAFTPSPDGVGTTWLYGTGAPLNGLGSNGNYYFDNDVNTVYFKALGAWEAKGSLDFIGVYGVQWGNGTGAPANIPSLNNLPAGSFYLDVATSDIYYKNPSLVWEAKGQFGNAKADVILAQAAQASAEAARDAALLSRGVFATTAKALSKGVTGLASLVGGTGGTNGTFALAFSGGAGSGAAGVFTVAGGIVVSTNITSNGDSYTSAPTVSFAASSGLTGASATAVIANNVDAGEYFSIPSAVTNGSIDLYLNSAGTAVLQKTYPNFTYVQKPKWAGKINAFPDPFFKTLDLTSKTFLNAVRWWVNTGSLPFNGWTRLANTTFDGYMLRRTANQGVSPVNGPVILLSDIGALAGDTITVYGLFTGSGAVVNFPARFDTGSDTAYVGGELGAANEATGGLRITSSSTPQWLRHSVVVPATATRLVLYPYTLTAGQTFDFVALWGFKGGVTDGPDWPNFRDDESLKQTDISLQAQITAKDRTGQTDYAILSTYSVTASATSVNLDVTGVTPNAEFGTPFSGWGERYTPAGISFNAVKVKSIGRKTSTLVDANKWRTINVVIRTGTNSQNAGATVVAIGSISVNPETNTLTDTIILLRDPTTLAVKTLTDADFSGSEYFIGIYALNVLGAVADISDHRATQSNTLGQSYYITTENPKTSSWATYTANVRLGVQHLLLTTPVEVVAYAPTNALAVALAATQAIVAPTVSIPTKLYLLAGREISMYFDNVILDDASNYVFDVTGATTGSQQAERFTTNPSAAVTSHTAALAIYDKKTGTQHSTTNITVVGVAASANSGVTKTCLFIGDSLMAAGTITQTLLDIVAAGDVMPVTLVGTRGTGANKHEGRGGWTVANYTTAGPTYYAFTVSGVTTTPQINSTTYTNNGQTFTVQETNISGGSGTITCSATGAPAASGTLTKSNAGIGDTTIAFSSMASQAGNPFWISGAVNFPQYLTNNSITAPTWVFIMLGINDVFSQTGDVGAAATADAAFVNLDTLITSIKATNGTIKVALIPPTPPSSSQDSFAASYGVGQTRAQFKRNILTWNKQLYTKYAGLEASRIYICPAHVNLDTVNNMQTATSAAVNSRSSVNVTRQNNGVHPATSGYQQIGDAVFAFLKNN